MKTRASSKNVQKRVKKLEKMATRIEGRMEELEKIVSNLAKNL